MAITTQNGIVAGLASATVATVTKGSVTGAAGSLVSQWLASGVPSAGAAPGVVARYPDDDTPGALVSIPALSPQQVYIGQVALANTAIGTEAIFDRLADVSGLDGTSVAAQPAALNLVSPASQGRCASTGADVEWYLEWYAATGGTAVTATIAYIDSADAPQTTTVSLAATRPFAFLARIIPSVANAMPIKSVVSVQLSGTTGAVGNFGVTAVRRIASVTCNIANLFTILDYAQLGLPVVTDKACLFFANINGTTATGSLSGNVRLISG